MRMLRQVVIFVLVFGVSSSTTDHPPAPTASPPTPAPSSTTPPPASSQTVEDPEAVQKPREDFVVPSASIRQVETPAVVEEVSDDWSDDFAPAEHDEAGETYDVEELSASDLDYPEYLGDYYYYADGDYSELYTTNDSKAPTQEDFLANVPQPLHYDKDIIISRDNLIPIMKTIILACTGKENPTYTELLKAGGITAFKTSLKHLGDEKLGIDLLALAKKLTTVFDSVEENEEEEDKILTKLAEDFLGSHRFKLVLPESILLHQAELEELLASRLNTDAEGRSASSESQLTIFMPRADPGVTTLFSMGPVSWITLLTGLLAVPYFMSGSSESEARVDNPARLPPPHLRPPSLPFFRTQQLRRDESESPPRHRHVDQEFLEYKKKYAQWYHQWYLKHKEYYDKNYPYNPQNHGQAQPGPLPSFPPQPLPPRTAGGGGGAVGPNSPRRKPKQPPQRRRKPAQRHRRPPHSQPSQKRPRVQPGRLHPRLRAPPAPFQEEAARNSGHNPPNSISGPNFNTFGTFQNEGNRGDSHFRVIHGSEAPVPSTVPPTSRVPSPQPVYIPTTKAVPTTETGFKPIIKPDAPVSDNPAAVRTQTVSESVIVPKEVKPNFRPPKQEELLPKNKPTPVPKKKTGTAPSVHLASGGFKPIPAPVTLSPLKPQPETTTRKVSSVTSSIFRTAATTPAPPVTHVPAVFFRTSSDKSVRVVTSSSVVTHPTRPVPVERKKPLPELKRPPRHQEAQALPQNLAVASRLQGEERKPTVVVESVPVGPQRLRTPHQTPAADLASGPLYRGEVRSNLPTTIRVVEHRPPQGFGLGPKPTVVTEPPTTPPPTTTTPTTPAPPTTTTIPIFALDPFYGSRLSRIDAIFNQLKVEKEGCREQVVCNIYKNPEVFTPFSDFLSRQLTVTLEELRRPKVSDERILRFFRYLKAARDGQDGSDCGARYPQCAQDTTALSHKPIMTTFQKVSRLMDASSS